MKNQKLFLMALLVLCSTTLFAAIPSSEANVLSAQQSCDGPCEEKWYEGLSITNVALHRTIVDGIEVTDHQGYSAYYPVSGVVLCNGESLTLPFHVLSAIRGVRVFTRHGFGRFIYRGISHFNE